MQQSETTADILNTQLNGNNQNNNNLPLITHKELEHTPFTITGNETQGYFLRIGDYRLTEYYKTHDEVVDSLYEYQWITIANLISAILDAYHKHDIKK